MASRKSSSRKTRRSQASAFEKLRRLGLTKTAAGTGTSKRLGGSQYRLLRKYRDVLEGRAAVVAAPSDVVRRYRGTFKTAPGKIVVPKSRGERVRLPRGAATIQKTKRITKGERPVHISIPPKATMLSGNRLNLPRGRNIVYRVNVGNARLTFRTLELLEEYLARYPSGHSFNVGFIEVVRLNRREMQEQFGDEE